MGNDIEELRHSIERWAKRKVKKGRKWFRRKKIGRLVAEFALAYKGEIVSAAEGRGSAIRRKAYASIVEFIGKLDLPDEIDSAVRSAVLEGLDGVAAMLRAELVDSIINFCEKYLPD